MVRPGSSLGPSAFNCCPGSWNSYLHDAKIDRWPRPLHAGAERNQDRANSYGKEDLEIYFSSALINSSAVTCYIFSRIPRQFSPPIAKIRHSFSEWSLPEFACNKFRTENRHCIQHNCSIIMSVNCFVDTFLLPFVCVCVWSVLALSLVLTPPWFKLTAT